MNIKTLTTLSIALSLLFAASNIAAAPQDASITQTMPSQPAVAPTTNVYDASNALSPADTRNLLALALALGIVGFLLLEENMLANAVERIAPSTPMRSTPLFSPPIGMGENAPAQ